MRSVLIANRGEIAVRIIYTLRVLGIRSVLIVSDADRNSYPSKLADEVIEIGGNTPTESYLNIEKVVGAALQAGVDAIHPGYGFLSERPEFVDACDQAGIIFIGPSAKSMQLLGNKVEAKLLATRLGVPLVPGFFEPNANTDQLKEAAIDIGFPVLLKAAAGGGGRGMKPVNCIEEFDGALKLASEEAMRAFGDQEMMVEKLVSRPRHIEIQLLADKHRQVFAIYERECSLQRRRQKVVEEAGAVLKDYPDKLWHPMRTCAINLLQEAEYEGAATAEFLVDGASGEFFFLEVNARLQVEHPISEAISGL
ncbi:MAG: biotin carboxylase N-terminal domain-containing protein, partial [Rhabdochlamydiaceae bacterium]